MPRIRVTKNEEKPESKEVLAAAVIKISEAMEDLLKSGLNKRAIIALVQDQTKIGKGDIETILDALSQLRGWYCR